MPQEGALRRSIATVSLSGTLEEKFDAIARAGFDGVELFEADLLGCPWTPREVRARCEDSGLRIELYQPVRDLEALPRSRHERALARAGEKLAVSAALGAPVMLACSNVARDAINDDDLAAQDLHALGELAADHGVRIAYEALSWGRFVNTFARSRKIVEAAGHASVGVCIDSFHVLSVGDTADELAGIDPSLLAFLQLADAPYVAMDLLQWSRHHRCFPGQGSFDLATFTAKVLAAGYAGPLSLEIFNDVVRWSDPFTTAFDAMRALLALESGARDALSRSSALRGRLRSLPPGAPPTSLLAVGVRAEGSMALGIEQTLAAMGFADDAVVENPTERRWRLGRADVRVRRRSGFHAPPHVVDELLLAAREPGAVAARARALLVETEAQEPGGGCALRAPDGRRIELRPYDDGERSAGELIEGIDHVVFTLSDDEFDEAMLFYRSVLLLEGQPSEELASPDGLVRSRALVSPHRIDRCPAVRVALNASTSPASHSQHREREHVALACGDIFAVAASWRARGVPLLDVSDNYYDDVRARFGLGEELLDALRELGVLYDQDAAGNEFFHCYTEAAGGRFFFELVERRPGYDGYGAANAGVRMSAQRWTERVAVRRRVASQ